MPLRFPRLSRIKILLLGLAVALVCGVVLFDWNWLRHPLESYLIHRSHRDIRIGNLEVDVGSWLEPTVHLRNVYVENAPWADKRPTAVIGEASVTFSLKSVWERRPVVSRLVLIDADIDLERRADGLRNWRLRDPEDRGPGRLKVLRLEPHRTKIRFIRRDIDLVIVAIASPSHTGAKGDTEDADHPTRINFDGRVFGTEFSGDVVTGAQLRFLETGESFPLRGHMSAVDSRLDFDGTVADLLKPSAMNAKVRLAGPSLSRFNAFRRTSLPASHRYEVAAQVRQRGRATDFDNLKGKIGTSDFAGSLRVDLSKARPMLTASLRGGSMAWSDLSSLGDSAGPGTAAHNAKGSAGEAGTPGGKPGQNGAVRDAVQRDRADDMVQGERLAAFDARVSVDVEKLSTTSLPELGPVRGTAQLEDGILVVKPIDVGLAGGHITGSLTVDGRKSPLAAHATMAFREVRLERLLTRLARQPQGAGPLEGSVDMKTTGATVTALLAHSSGTMEASMEGGVISNMLDAKLGLNGGKILRLLIAGDRAIGIRRAVVAFDFEKGIGRSRTILLDTDQTRTEGEGVIDLTDQTLDVLLTPHRKKPGIFALRSSIRIQGPIRQPAFSLEKKAKAKAESADADTR